MSIKNGIVAGGAIKHVVAGGAKIATIVTRTNVKLTGGKANPQQGRVQKVSKVNVMIGVRYENCVNNQLAREGKDQLEFKAGLPPWGESIKGTPFLIHTPKEGGKKVYLQCKVNKSLGHEYLLDGTPIAEEQVIGLPKKRAEGANQGTEKAIIWRPYQLASIVELRINGENYAVNEDEEKLYDELKMAR